MLQSEIDEISKSFLDAWKEYFGDLMYYVKFDSSKTDFDDIYGESKDHKYDFENAVPFYATIKESEDDDIIQPYGKRDIRQYTLNLVTKQLLDAEILAVDSCDVIVYRQHIKDSKYTLRFFKIVGDTQKVQFGSNKIFTKIFVTEDSYSIYKSAIPKGFGSDENNTNLVIGES